MTPDSLEPRRSRGLYLLPNLFTTAALFCGFYAIIGALHSRFKENMNSRESKELLSPDLKALLGESSK